MISLPFLNITASEFPLIIGFWVAFIHVLSGPDHLAAVSPLVLEHKERHWKIGLLWGLGHLVGMLLIGLLFLFFKEHIPIESISAHSEQLVGIVLILLGLWSFYRIFYDKKRHVHPHIHQEDTAYLHIHKHHHDHEHTHKHVHNKVNQQNTYTSFFIGVLHGFAGIAHFILLLPVLGFSSKVESILYISGFGIGTIVSMSLFAYALGKIALLSKKGHNTRLFNTIRLWGGIIAILVGIYWLF